MRRKVEKLRPLKAKARPTSRSPRHVLNARKRRPKRASFLIFRMKRIYGLPRSAIVPDPMIPPLICL